MGISVMVRSSLIFISSAPLTDLKGSSKNGGSTHMNLDIRYIKDVQTLDYRVNVMKIQDKWAKDKVGSLFLLSGEFVLSGTPSGFSLSRSRHLSRSHIQCQLLHRLL